MLETGYRLKKEEVDDFRIKLRHLEHDIRLQSYTMPEHDAKLTQIPPKTKFLCVHGYGCIKQDGVSFQSLDNNSNYLCVLFVFVHAVMKQEYSKCFVRALAVSNWMAITKNQKKVMIGNKYVR